MGQSHLKRTSGHILYVNSNKHKKHYLDIQHNVQQYLQPIVQTIFT